MASRKLSTVVASGDLRASLEATRDKLAVELEACQGAAAATLAKELVDVMRRLESMPVGEGSKVDDLAKRRATRRATEVPDAPNEGVKRGTGGGRTRS